MISKDRRSQFYIDLQHILNCHNVDGYTNTPDFILAEHIIDELNTLATLMRNRDSWHGYTHGTHATVVPLDDPIPSYGHVDEGPHPLPNLDERPPINMRGIKLNPEG